VLEQAAAQAKQHYAFQVAPDWTKSLPQTLRVKQYLLRVQILTIWFTTTKKNPVSTAAPTEDNLCFIYVFLYSLYRYEFLLHWEVTRASRSCRGSGAAEALP